MLLNCMCGPLRIALIVLNQAFDVWFKAMSMRAVKATANQLAS